MYTLLEPNVNIVDAVDFSVVARNIDESESCVVEVIVDCIGELPVLKKDRLKRTN